MGESKQTVIVSIKLSGEYEDCKRLDQPCLH